MSSALNARRAAIIIGSISAAIVCASAALHWYRKRRSPNRRQKLSKSASSSTPAKRQLSPKVRDQRKGKEEVKEEVPVQQEGTVGDSVIESSSSEKEIEMTTTVASFSNAESGRGGRRDYRHHRRNRDEASAVQMNGCCGLDREGAANTVAPNASAKSAFQSPPSCISKHCQANIFNDPAIVDASAPVIKPSQQSASGDWLLDDAQRRQRASDAELRGAQLAAEFSAKCQVLSKQDPSKVQYANGEADSNAIHAGYQDGVAHDAPSPLSSIKGQCVESPSLSSDMHSEVCSYYCFFFHIGTVRGR